MAESSEADLLNRFKNIIAKEKELTEEHLKMLLRVSMSNEKLKGDANG